MCHVKYCDSTFCVLWQYVFVVIVCYVTEHVFIVAVHVMYYDSTMLCIVTVIVFIVTVQVFYFDSIFYVLLQ